MKKIILLGLFISINILTLRAGILKGVITDKDNQEPLIGATIQLLKTNKGTVTNFDGCYQLEIQNGIYDLEIKYVGYKNRVIKGVSIKGEKTLNITLESDAQLLKDVTVVATRKHNTEMSLMTDQRRSLVIESGVSAQQISRTQDKDASEVIKRIPGISIINNKFVMVRGLSQRYNNVWINGGAVPSSEADSRAFSFDLLPSSQLDNMVVVKSPSPEYPADWSGGFIKIKTKEIPNKNLFSIGISSGINDETHFHDFLYNKKHATNFLGFSNNQLKGGISGTLTPISENGVDLKNNNFNNDWTIKKKKPLPNLGLRLNFNRHKEFNNGSKAGISGAINYSNSFKSYLNMENSLFGAYDDFNDQSNYLRHTIDNQYNHNIRLGAMLNITFIPKNQLNQYELKNIFNKLSKDRYTNRKGFDAQDNKMEGAEYYYSSRTTYNGQFTGKHTFTTSKLDWSAGYAYSNRNLPDRRRYTINDALQPDVLALTRGNDINREYTKLDEHIFSINANYKKDFDFGYGITPTLKAGLYNEYRTRKYRTRQFDYYWNYSNNNLPKDFRTMDIANELLTPQHYGADGLYLLEDVKWRNNYDGNNLLLAGYTAFNFNIGEKFNIYTGVRFEHNKMELISNTRDAEESNKSTFYEHDDFFPSINMSYELTEKQKFRLSYGRSINRPEFREVSSSVYYDFDLGSAVQGNPLLENCYINNVDFRYEYYPSNGEIISAALFYKKFDNPIEWTYTVTGGTDLVYSFNNAKGAYSLGVELEIKKDLAFIGLENFKWSFNGSIIKSKVNFDKNEKQRNRQMQGQSPYLINTGFFYEKKNISLSLLYNRIEKRIIGVGRTVGLTGGENSANIPDSYEMPRDMIDVNSSFRIGSKWQFKLNVKNLLAQKVYYKQFTNVKHKNGVKETVEEITKSYKPGRTFNLSINYTF